MWVLTSASLRTIKELPFGSSRAVARTPKWLTGVRSHSFPLVTMQKHIHITAKFIKNDFASPQLCT